MIRPHVYGAIADRLRAVGLRPTRQRLALATVLLADGRDRHVTAESLHREVRARDVAVSLATVYNALHQFTNAGLLREVVVDAARSYFDTNTTHHHHFYDEDSRSLIDIPGSGIDVAHLPEPPPGSEIAQVDVVVRIRRPAQAAGASVRGSKR